MSARRILVIDDDDDIREVAQTSLELVGGHEVLTAASGGDGLASARAERPDAILLDVMMPGMDGPATLRRLRAEPATRAIPVVLLTAKVRADDRAFFAGLDVAGVISKPFDPVGLPTQVAATLGWAE